MNKIYHKYQENVLQEWLQLLVGLLLHDTEILKQYQYWYDIPELSINSSRQVDRWNFVVWGCQSQASFEMIRWHIIINASLAARNHQNLQVKQGKQDDSIEEWPQMYVSLLIFQLWAASFSFYVTTCIVRWVKIDAKCIVILTKFLLRTGMKIVHGWNCIVWKILVLQ